MRFPCLNFKVYEVWDFYYFSFSQIKTTTKSPKGKETHAHTGNTLITLNNFRKNHKIRTKHSLNYNSLCIQLYSEMVPKYLPKEAIFMYKLLVFWYYTTNNTASNQTEAEPALAAHRSTVHRLQSTQNQRTSKDKVFHLNISPVLCKIADAGRS